MTKLLNHSTSLIDDFSPRGRKITDDLRQRISICPPSNYNLDGDIIPFPEEFLQHYEDAAVEKRRIVVYVTDWMDDSYADASRYKMMLRGVSNDADLTVICDAAKHLCLIDAYEINRGTNIQLGPEYEKDWVMIKYSIYRRTVLVDSEELTIVNQPVLQSADLRRTIWRGLFEAAGYRVRDGVIDVRKITPARPKLKINDLY